MLERLTNWFYPKNNDDSGSSNPPPAKRARAEKENLPESDDEEPIIEKTEEVQEDDEVEADEGEQRILRFGPVEQDVEFDDYDRAREDDENEDDEEEEEEEIDANVPLVNDDDEMEDVIGTDENQDGSAQSSSELPKRSLRASTVQLRERKQKEWQEQDELENNKENMDKKAERRMQEREEDINDHDTVQKPNFELDETTVPYNADKNIMIQSIKASVQSVEYDENATFVAAETRRRQMIEDDPLLEGHLKIENPDRIQQEVLEYKLHHVLKNLEENFGNQKKQKKGVKRPLTQQAGPSRTNKKSSKKRIRVMQNITGNKREVIPVYCDISRNVNEVDIPTSLTYKYSDTNISRRAQLDRLNKQIEVEDKVIKCDCHDQTPIVNCYENPSCPCYQANLKLMKVFQIGDEKHVKVDIKKECWEHDFKTTKFETFKPVHLKPCSFDDIVGFACSDLCRCKGHCTNNVTLLLDKKLTSFEIERKNETLGFQVKTQSFIPAGTVISEFTGELLKYSDLVERDYAYRIVNSNSLFVRKLLDVIGSRSGELDKLMREAYGACLYVDPKYVGNVARTFNTSCETNAELVKVYQKSFSPSQMRVLVVATENIFPGDELNLDYGDGYSKYLPGGCNCGAVSCKSKVVTSFPDKEDKEYGKKMILLKKKIAKEIQGKHSAKFNDFKSQVLEKL